MTALSRRVSAFASKTSMEDVLRAHDRAALRRVPVVTAVRALAAVGLSLHTDEASVLFAPFLVQSSTPAEVGGHCQMGGAHNDALSKEWRWKSTCARPVSMLSPLPQLNYAAFCAAFNDTLAPGSMETTRPCVALVEAAAAARAAASAITVSPVAAGSAGAFAPLSAIEALELDSLLGRVRHIVATRGLALQSYLREFDATHRGVITATQFMRTLSATLPTLSSDNLNLLAKAYVSSDGVDTRYIVFANDVSAADDTQASGDVAAATAAWPQYASASGIISNERNQAPSTQENMQASTSIKPRL